MNPHEFEITDGPSIWRKDHVKLKSLSELRRLCHQFNIPLLHMSDAQHFVGHIPVDNATYELYFASMSGMYYAYIEQKEDTEGVSS